PVGDGVLGSALLAVMASDARASEALETTAAEGTAAPAGMGSLPSPAHQPKGLIPEGNGANPKILRRLLGKAGPQGAAGNDGEAALAVLDRDRFDLALMDINMPEMSGYEVTKLYRMEHLGESRLPIIALTADATSETERQCREAGMDAVLTKPVEAAHLLAAIDGTYSRVALP